MELNYNRLIVKQKMEMMEILSGIETKNKYQILSENGEEVLFAYEESNTLARIFLNRMRALSIKFLDKEKSVFLKVEKEFAFFFPEFSIFNSENQEIARVKTKFGIKSKLEIYDNNNQLIFYCINEIMHPWTFNIYRTKVEENSLGIISKKWSGAGKEIFTDADNFLIDFKQINEEIDKERVLALSLIIDLFVFEI